MTYLGEARSFCSEVILMETSGCLLFLIRVTVSWQSFQMACWLPLIAHSHTVTLWQGRHGSNKHVSSFKRFNVDEMNTDRDWFCSLLSLKSVNLTSLQWLKSYEMFASVQSTILLNQQHNNTTAQPTPNVWPGALYPSSLYHFSTHLNHQFKIIFIFMGN